MTRCLSSDFASRPSPAGLTRSSDFRRALRGRHRRRAAMNRRKIGTRARAVPGDLDDQKSGIDDGLDCCESSGDHLRNAQSPERPMAIRLLATAGEHRHPSTSRSRRKSSCLLVELMGIDPTTPSPAKPAERGSGGLSRPRLHPGWLAARMTAPFRHSYHYGSRHPRQDRDAAPGPPGRPKAPSRLGLLVRVYERKGHHYHESDCLVCGADGVATPARSPDRPAPTCTPIGTGCSVKDDDRRGQ